MQDSLLIIFGSLFSKTIQTLGLGNGTTWPGHIALSKNKFFVRDVLTKNPQLKVIIVAGTNGKTTTSAMLRTILVKSGKKVIQNNSGANLQNGIASTLLLAANVQGKIKADFAIFEVDENAFPALAQELHPSCVVLLNLFRDQLDRYGEVNTIAAKWKEALKNLDKKTIVVANGDDPLIVAISEQNKLKKHYFGLTPGKNHKTEHASDSTYCPECGEKLVYKSIQFSHLGDWYCTSCGLKRPKITSREVPMPLLGSYNQYNGLAALITTRILGIAQADGLKSLSRVAPAFGRQEVFKKDGKTIQIFLSKNPTGMNESLRTIKNLGGRYMLFLLNDRIPDGTDVSWIWDVDVETLISNNAIIMISGDRAYDMGLRVKYASKSQELNTENKGVVCQIETNSKNALKIALKQLPIKETLYVLPTYSAMLDIRKILSGKKIL